MSKTIDATCLTRNYNGWRKNKELWLAYKPMAGSVGVSL